MPAPTIEEIVAQIRRALYGRDVRENIALGIEKCYTDVTSGVTVAETAASTANTAATNANTKATLANTKATLANTAAENADAKATLANTAATNANTKADLANTAATNANTKADLADTKAALADAAALKIDNMTVSATGLPTGSSPTATVTEAGSDNHKSIAFGIPKGDTGAVPNISIGTVTTVLPDQQATVTRRSGSPDTAPVFDFAIPKGNTGSVTDVYGTSVPISESDDTSIATVINNRYTSLMQDMGTKADLVDNAVEGHLASLDVNGNLVDSGLDPSIAIGNKIIMPSTAISIPASGSTSTINFQGITSDHVVVLWNFSTNRDNDPPVSLTVTTYDGYFTVKNDEGSTNQTMQPVFAVPTKITVSNS